MFIDFKNFKVQIDKNLQVCDFIFPEKTAPSKSLIGYKEEKKAYDDYCRQTKEMRSNLLNLFRGRPYKLVINQITDYDRKKTD